MFRRKGRLILLLFSVLLTLLLTFPSANVRADTAIFHLEGSVEWYSNAETVVNAVGAGDFDDDGVVEIVTGGYAELATGRHAQLRVWEFNGTAYTFLDGTEWRSTGDTQIEDLFVSDADRDGVLEILTVGWYQGTTYEEAQLSAFNFDGTNLNYEGGTNWYDTGDTRANGIWAVNCDTDNSIEVITIGHADISFVQGELKLWEYSGMIFSIQETKHYHYDVVSPSWGNDVAAGQCDSDGFIEIMGVGKCKRGSDPEALESRIWHVESGVLVQEVAYDSHVMYAYNEWLAVSVGDYNGDGDDEFIKGGHYNHGGTYAGYLEVTNDNGAGGWTNEGYRPFHWTGDARIDAVGCVDIDGDGEGEILAAGRGHDSVRERAILFAAHHNNLLQPPDKIVQEAYISWYGAGNTGVNALWTGPLDDDTIIELVTGGFESDETRLNAQLRIWNCDLQLPNQVTLQGPSSGTETNDNTSLFSWLAATDPSPSSGIAGYYWEVDTSAAFDTSNRRSIWLGNITIYTPSALPDGTWFWRVCAQDYAGYNGTWSATWNLLIDTVGPNQPGLLTPFPATVTTDNTPTFTWTAANDPLPSSGVAGYYWDADINSLFSSPNRRCIWVGNTLSYTPSALSDGTWYWRIFATDDAGNNGTYSTVWNLDIDTSGPSWDQTPANQVSEFGFAFQYDLNASDWHGVDAWWINDTINFDIDSSGIITNNLALSVDVYWLQVWVNDTLDNTQTTIFSITVQDTTDPTWDSVPTDQLAELGQPILYDVDASDLSGVTSYWINDSSNFAIDGSGLISNITILMISEYWVEVRAYDPYSNYATATFRFIVQDGTSPTWVALPTDQTVEAGQVFVYDVDATDLSNIDHYWINDTSNFAIDGNGGITNATTLSAGIYWLEVRAYDPFTNYIAATFKVTIQDTTDPTWDQTPTNQNIEFGVSFLYTLNASDFSGIDHWWINDTTNFVISSTGQVTNIGLLPAGTYTLEVRAYDPHNNYCTATFTVTVQAPPPPGIPGFPIEAIALGVIASLGVGLLVRRRRRK